MALAPQEVLDGLVAATADAKAATREAHEASKDLRGLMKEQKRLIVEEIAKDVATAVQAIEAETVGEMRSQVSGVIARIEQDWRTKLGLDA